MDDDFTKSDTTTLIISEPTSINDTTLPKLEEEIRFHLEKINQSHIEIGNHIIEIGKRLIQAKSLLKHGEWLNWLQDNFQLSYPTATKFMKCAERFPNVASNHLTSTQMIQLLALPSAEETEEFIKQKVKTGTPVADMSIRTLNKEIKQWKSAKEEITPTQSNENEQDITVKDTAPSQNPDNSDSPIQNEPVTITLNNHEPQEQSHINSPQLYSEIQPSISENLKSNFVEEQPISKTNSQIQETNLIEEIFNLSVSLMQQDRRNEILQNFAKNNPEHLLALIQNLNTIISELQTIIKNDQFTEDKL